MVHHVGYMLGLAKASINRKLAAALVRLAPPDLEYTEIGFGDLPLYGYDCHADFLPPALDFRAKLARVDALVVGALEWLAAKPIATLSGRS